MSLKPTYEEAFNFSDVSGVLQCFAASVVHCIMGQKCPSAPHLKNQMNIIYILFSMNTVYAKRFSA